MASASHQNHFSYYFVNVTYVYPDDTGAQTETMNTCFAETSYIKNEQVIPLIATKPQQHIADVKSVMQLFKLAMVKNFLSKNVFVKKVKNDAWDFFWPLLLLGKPWLLCPIQNQWALRVHHGPLFNLWKHCQRSQGFGAKSSFRPQKSSWLLHSSWFDVFRRTCMCRFQETSSWGFYSLKLQK